MLDKVATQILAPSSHPHPPNLSGSPDYSKPLSSFFLMLLSPRLQGSVCMKEKSTHTHTHTHTHTQTRTHTQLRKHSVAPGRAASD